MVIGTGTLEICVIPWLFGKTVTLLASRKQGGNFNVVVANFAANQTKLLACSIQDWAV